MKNIVIGLMTMMLLIVISLIYTTIFFCTIQSDFNITITTTTTNSFCKLTKSDMLGPFYKANAPFKQRLGEGIEGERLIITGKVMDMRCNH